MKARIKTTGEIVDVRSVMSNDNTDMFVCRQNDKVYSINELEIIYPIDWEQRRYELIKEAMGANIAVIGINCFNENVIISTSIDIADAIIKKLKESEENK